MGYHYMQKLLPYFNYGIKTLLDKGVVYTNAYWPHGTPSTGPGHAGLNTGAYGKDSGIVSNSWTDGQGHKVECDSGSAENAAVIGQNGLYDYGKSPNNLMVPGVSDSLAMQSQPCAKTKVFSISLKSRAAILTAGKQRTNQAIWFDAQTGCMTSSTYYGSKLPEWLEHFNKTSRIKDLTSFKWDLLYPKDSEYYCFNDTQENGVARSYQNIVATKISASQDKADFYHMFEKTPIANQMLFDCAKACIKANLGYNRDDRMLLWISLSPLDKLGHIYGPESLAVIDMLYQLDYQLHCFMHYVDRRIKRSDVAYVFTADHGMGPIPELLEGRGYPAIRDNSRAIEQKINEKITKKTGTSIKVFIKTPNIHFSDEYALLDKKKQKDVLGIARSVLLSQKSVKNVWTPSELKRLCSSDQHVESFFKNQYYEGRSGKLIVQTAPFAQLTQYEGGTTHEGPYEVNIHVPLIIYRHQFFEHKIVNTKVSMLQLANTIAHILQVPKPAASTAAMLPGLIPDEQDFVL
jgi:predicted AlkP superfamily pyrophosphatase or phosphodiesterase